MQSTIKDKLVEAVDYLAQARVADAMRALTRALAVSSPEETWVWRIEAVIVNLTTALAERGTSTEVPRLNAAMLHLVQLDREVFEVDAVTI